MDTRKKLILMIACVTVAIVLAIVGLVVVLVVSNQSVTSPINMQYTVNGVGVRVSANGIIGSTEYTMKSGNNAFLDLTPNNQTGTLNQVDAKLSLNNDNPKIVYEYVFTNLSDTLDVDIALSSTPATKTNVELSYAYSNTRITNHNLLDKKDEYANQLLEAGTQKHKYIYIIARVVDTMINANFEGTFSWSLTIADTTTYTVDLSNADYIYDSQGNVVNASSVGSVKTLSSATDIDIDIVPQKVNYAFVGWSNQANATEPLSAINANMVENANIIGANTSGTLYPVFLQSSLTGDSFYTYNSSLGGYVINCSTITTTATQFVIPDLYNKSGTGVYPVVAIGDATLSTSILKNNKTVKHLVLGRNIKSIGTYSLNYTEKLETINLPKSLETLKDFAFAYCTSIKNIDFPIGLKTIGVYAFQYSVRITKLYIPASVTSIGLGAFAYCYRLESINVDKDNIVYDSYGNCNAIVHTSTAKIVAGMSTTVIQPRIKILGNSCFMGMITSATDFVIPYGIENTENNLFFGCTGLKTLYIPASITRLGNGQVSSCSNLTAVTFEEPQGWVNNSGVSVDFSDPATNVIHLRDTYYVNAWTRS